MHRNARTFSGLENSKNSNMTLNADEDSMNRKFEYNENRDLVTNTSAAVTNANGASKTF